MTRRWMIPLLIACAISGCGRGPEGGQTPANITGYQDQATGGRYDAENEIPLAMRGAWTPVAAGSGAAAAGAAQAVARCAGPVLRVDDDRLAYPYADALLETIDQISADYLRGTFTMHVDDHIERYPRVLAVDAHGTRLTIRGTKPDGTATVERYRRCQPDESQPDKQ